MLGDPVLREKAAPVLEFDEGLRQLAERVDAGVAKIVEYVRPQEPDPSAATPATITITPTATFQNTRSRPMTATAAPMPRPARTR